MFHLSRITAAAVGALGIAAFATTGVAAANTVDDTFIEVINQQGIQPPSDAEAISVAHDACAVIDGRGDIAAAVDAVSEATKLDFEDSAFFVGAAIASYCPEHEDLIG
nr:DUF732 domain-containing protein [Mycolicibacterium malmesburyense]CRL75708.1 hypothetical protein CPGR_03675 [Mycolicibacterium malmesburyense]